MLDLSYRKIIIKKRSGKKRILFSPSRDLRIAQEMVLDKIHENGLDREISDNAMAFRNGRSVIMNAKWHKKGKRFVIVDMKDFFTNITYKKFVKHFVNKHGEEAKFMKNKHFKESCFYGEGNVKYLPQGALTSPVLSNLYMSSFDEVIVDILEKETKLTGLTYTRYADDMVFSWEYKANVRKTYFLSILEHELRKIGLFLNHNKTKIKNVGDQIKITGITLNDDAKLTVGHRKKRQIKNIIKLKNKIEAKGLQWNNKILNGNLAWLESVEPENKNFYKEIR